MFGRESKQCMVFEYGCLPPVSGEQEAVAEMRRRNDLWNSLVEIEREHQAKVAALLKPEDDPIAPLLERLKELREKIKAKRKAARSGKVDVSDLLAEVSKVKAELASAREVARAARKKRIEETRAQLDALEATRRAAVKEAQHKSGLFWCNYEEVVNTYTVARLRAMREHTQLRFHRWDGTGKVTVRYQTGLSADEVFGSDSRLQIDPVPPEAWTSPVRAERRKLARTKIRLRVTSNERKPVWIELPMVMHRPLPKDGTIRNASVIREKVGRNYRWKATITVALGEQEEKPQKPGTIAIDIGWRTVPEGLRVAYWCDDEGKEGQVVLGPEIVEPFLKLDDLRSIRDKHFNEAISMLQKWLAEHNDIVPDWLREDAAGLASWRSQGRLVSLVNKWKSNRFEGDEDIVSALEEWRKRENHLYDWEANQRDQVQRRRREQYRIFAAQVVRKYGKIILEDFDLRQVVRKPAPEQGTQGALPIDRYRFIASVSQLRQALENAARREGVEIVTVPADRSTYECHVCGHVEKFDTAMHLWHTCSACGALWDQDLNAAKVLLKRGQGDKSHRPHA